MTASISNLLLLYYRPNEVKLLTSTPSKTKQVKTSSGSCLKQLFLLINTLRCKRLLGLKQFFNLLFFKSDEL